MKKHTLILLVSLLFVSSCAKQVFYLEEEGKKLTQPAVDEWSHFFIGGIAQKDIINAKEICGANNKVTKIETELTVLNAVISWLTFSIYTPRQYRVYCLRN